MNMHWDFWRMCWPIMATKNRNGIKDGVTELASLWALQGKIYETRWARAAGTIHRLRPRGTVGTSRTYCTRVPGTLVPERVQAPARDTPASLGQYPNVWSDSNIAKKPLRSTGRLLMKRKGKGGTRITTNNNNKNNIYFILLSQIQLRLHCCK
jgi:hypothetical protein